MDCLHLYEDREQLRALVVDDLRLYEDREDLRFLVVDCKQFLSS
jgi:hypothetical protein